MRPTLATEGGKPVTKLSKVRHAAARPDMEIARLRRCLASIRAEAEKSREREVAFEALMQAVFRASCGDDPVVTRAMVQEACIELRGTQRSGLVARYCEMAEEGTLCA